MPHHPLLFVSQQGGVRAFHYSGFDLGSGAMALSTPTSMLQSCLAALPKRLIKENFAHALRRQPRDFLQLGELGTAAHQHLSF